MRLWSIHPKYLDTKGLLAVWREGLLAKKVLQGRTKGYTKHPQLIRFKNHPNPQQAINHYLTQIYNESKARGFNFDQTKINKENKKIEKISVTLNQIEYEFNHLKNKIKQRAPIFYKNIQDEKKIETNHIFKLISGEIEPWEKIS